MVDPVLQMLHGVDRDASGKIAASEEITNPHTRDRYLVRSLIEEAVTSSQLEGAATTIDAAKDMIRSGRRPADRGEQMVLNNYTAMQWMRERQGDPLSSDLVLELHRLVTDGEFDSLDASGRFRRADEDVRVRDEKGQILHTPPDASELPKRLKAMCGFANGEYEKEFIHPVVRAIILHFWLAYDHPFADGNGRTARAIFYWSMLSQGYWLFEYVSVSRILKQAPAKYARSFLYTETDANDLTYFLIYQLEVIQRAIRSLYEYFDQKAREVREIDHILKGSGELNHRQIALLGHALRHPGFRYTIRSHRTSHSVVYETARSDLLRLADLGFLDQRTVGNRYLFVAPPDLAMRLEALA